MDDDIDKISEENFYEANVILCYIFIIINAFIMIFSTFIFITRSQKIKLLKTRLYEFILIDSLSFIINIHKNSKNYGATFLYELFFSSIISFEFFIFISFIYQIFNTTETSNLSQNLELKNPNLLSMLSFFIIFPYHKISYHYHQLINIMQYIIILCCIIIFFKYLSNTIISISRNITSINKQDTKIYQDLKMLNLICLILLLSFNVLKVLLLFIPNSLQIYIEILLTIINQSLKYLIIILFGNIIYALNKKSNNNITEEAVNIIQMSNN